MTEGTPIESTLILRDRPHKYPPSIVDWLTSRIARLIFPPWLTYAILFVILVGIEAAIQWTLGPLPRGAVMPFHVFFTVAAPFMLLMIHYLDEEAANALETFRPALIVSDVEYRELRYRIMTMPAREVNLVILTSIIVIFAALAMFNRAPWMEIMLFSTAPISIAFNIGLGFCVWPLFFVLMYHTYHQLRLINHIYVRYTRINLLQQGPLYAFSSVTGRTAVGLIVLAYGWTVSMPEGLREFVAISYLGPAIAVGAAAFIAPLLGVHGLLLAEKDRMLGECTRRLEAMTDELHRRISQNEIARMDALNKAMASLELERSLIQRVPTWPWQPETLRGVAAAIAFPLFVWLIQSVLQRVIVP